FIVAARHESFVAAGAELCLTPAAVSKSIKALEHQLDARLFQRFHQGVSLTPAGAQLATLLEPIFDQLHNVLHLGSMTRPVSSITVCAYPTTIASWLIPEWSAIRHKSPSFTLNLV